MRLRVFLSCLLAALLAWGAASADYLRVSRPATVKSRPAADAAIRLKVETGTNLRLLANRQTHGYYHVQPFGEGHAGWIYRSFVRRYHGEAEAEPAAPTTPGGGPGETGNAGPLGDASAFKIANCPPEGNAQKASVLESNPYKNRLKAPLQDQVATISLEAMLTQGDDRTRWSRDDGAEVTGYVENVKSGGTETCNCRSEDRDDWDTHIELTLGPEDTGPTRRVIVEVTPPWRRLMATAGKDWSTAGLKGTILHRYVRVRGWLFFDAEHDHQAENTEPDGDSNWRATAWEIHPITAMEVVPNP